MTANCLLSVLGMIMSRIVENVCNVVLFLIAVDLLSSYGNIHYVGLCK